MSADIDLDEGELPEEPGGPYAEPTGSYQVIVIIECRFPDGKLWQQGEANVTFDHPPSEAEIQEQAASRLFLWMDLLADYPHLQKAGVTCRVTASYVVFY